MAETLKKYGMLISISLLILGLIKIELFFLVFGTFIFIVSVKAIYLQNNLLKNGVKTIGVFKSFESDNEGYKTPFIEFNTLIGEKVEAKPIFYTSTDLSKIKSYSNLIGKTVQVIYDPNKPKDFIIENESGNNTAFAVIFGLGGIVFVIVSILSLTGKIKFG